MPRVLGIYPSDLQFKAPTPWGIPSFAPQAGEFVASLQNSPGEAVPYKHSLPEAGQTGLYLSLRPSLGLAGALEKKQLSAAALFGKQGQSPDATLSWQTREGQGPSHTYEAGTPLDSTHRVQPSNSPVTNSNGKNYWMEG